MRGGLLPPALVCAALGLALCFTRPRHLGLAPGLFAASAAVAASAPVPPLSLDLLFTGCWVTVLVTAASVHLPRGLGPRAAGALALNAGAWAGMISHVGAEPSLVAALPFVLLVAPGQWLRGRGWGVAVKVAASWLIAIAGLEALLVLVPTPGYAPDHMD